MDKIINQFLEYLEVEKGLSLITVKNYSFYLRRFAEFAKNQGASSPAKVSKDLVHKYRLWLNRLNLPAGKAGNAKGQGLKKNTQNYHLIALRGFLKYLVKNDIKSLEPEKVELAKQEQRRVDFLEGSDLERILEAPLKIELPEIIKKRDKAILELFFSTGLRVSELCKLKIENINLKKDEFTVRGKGAKLRVVFLSEEAKRAIEEYLKFRHDVNPYLFVSHDKAASGRGEQAGLSPRSVQRLVEKYAKAAGITKEVTPHTLRHSYATDLLMNGADIRSVQAMLGHASITTTQVYTHITDQQLRDVHKAFHGRKRG